MRPHTNVHGPRIVPVKEHIATPYVDYYIASMDKMDNHLNKRMQRLLSKSFDASSRKSRFNTEKAKENFNSTNYGQLYSGEMNLE